MHFAMALPPITIDAFDAHAGLVARDEIGFAQDRQRRSSESIHWERLFRPFHLVHVEAELPSTAVAGRNPRIDVAPVNPRWRPPGQLPGIVMSSLGAFRQFAVAVLQDANQPRQIYDLNPFLRIWPSRRALIGPMRVGCLRRDTLLNFVRRMRYYVRQCFVP